MTDEELEWLLEEASKPIPGASWVIVDDCSWEFFDKEEVKYFLGQAAAYGFELQPTATKDWKLAPPEPTDEMIERSGVPENLSKRVWRRLFDAIDERKR